MHIGRQERTVFGEQLQEAFLDSSQKPAVELTIDVQVEEGLEHHVHCASVGELD